MARSRRCGRRGGGGASRRRGLCTRAPARAVEPTDSDTSQRTLMEIAAARGYVPGTAVSPRLAAQRALLPWPELSVFATCAAVAFLPFLQPAGPGNMSP